jgi:hypothetical protein
VSPTGWCINSIMILQVHVAKRHGAHFLAPLSHVRRSLSAILYVDDTDLLHLNMDTNESVQDIHAVLQCGINNWGCHLLIAIRGCLKPEKRFFCLMDFKWSLKGGWQYIAHHEHESAVVSVPMPDGTMSPITYLAVDEAQRC